MFKMRCRQCSAVFTRHEMPFHIREKHNNISYTPTQPQRNASRTQDSTTTEPTSGIARPERETFRKEIRDIVHGFTALPDNLRRACGESVGKMPVLGALYAYTFTHLQLCAPEKRSLIAKLERHKTELSTKGDDYLSNLKSMKDELVHILQMSQVEEHICNTRLINEKKLHDLDINIIGTLIVEHTTSNKHAPAFYANGNAQFMADILQNLLTARPGILEQYRKYLVNAVFKLSRKSGRFPQSLQLSHIQDLTHTEFHGRFGWIYQGQLNGHLVAVKKVAEGEQHSPEQSKVFANEAVIWYYVRHANCLPCYGVYVFDDAEPKWCLVSPWMKDGHVNHYLKSYPDADRYPLILDVARGLEYLHSMEPALSHCDLKGVNILITSSGRACIADFGIAKARDSFLKKTTTCSSAGTRHFMAPELLNGKTDLQKLDRRPCDMYALACVCYEMFTGMPPFADKSDVARRVLSQERPERPLEVRQDDFMWSLMQALWSHQPRDRPTAGQVCSQISLKMNCENKNTNRPATEVEWDRGFLTDATETEDPFELAA